MATATSSALPTVLRSSSPRAPGGNADIPSRHRSNTQRPTSSSHRSSSRSYTHDPPVLNHAALANAARRDHETINLARRPSSRRSSSRDRASEYHAESARGQHRERSRPGSSRISTEISGGAAVVANGGSVPSPTAAPSAHPERPSTSGNASMGRRRTSIITMTGTWWLGKTIGQGSMGKVKLAKNIETGEQVCEHHCCRGVQLM